MDQLRRKVRRVERRLGLQQLLNVLAWCWFASLLAAAVWVGVDKFVPLGVVPEIAVGGSLALGLAAAVVVTFLRGPSSLDAAVALDRAFDLRERVSSTLTLGPELRETAAGQALVADTLKRVEAIDVRERFGLRLPRRAWLPLPAALAVLFVALVLNPATDSASAKANEQRRDDQKRIEQSAKNLRQKLAERKQKAIEAELAEAQDLFQKLEKSTRELSKSKQAERKNALAEINNLADQIKERRAELKGAEELKNRLQDVKSLDKGPADRLADALKQGDLNKAAKEIEKLKEQIEKGKLNKEQMDALKNQLAQMQQKLQELADVEKRREELEKRREELAQKGQSTDDIDRQLEQLKQQAQQLKQLQQLAKKLGECKACVDAGNLKEAADALGLAKEDLENLAKALKELDLLEEALQELADARNAMNCEACKGAG